MREIWKPVLGYENNYAVSDKGNVFSWIRNRPMSKIKQSVGYLRTHLSGPAGAKEVGNHILVMEAFRGERPYGKVVNHIDGNKENNCLENLEYVTQGENQRKAGEMGLMAHGEKHHRAKLTKKDVKKIRTLAEKGFLQEDLGKKYKVSQAHISNIVLKKSWRHI